MIIKPIERGVNKMILLKIGALVFIIGLGFVSSKLLTGKQPAPSAPQVLSIQSENIDPGKSVTNLTQNVVDRSKNLAGQVLDQAKDITNEMASKSANAVSNFLIDAVTEPIVNQIKKLPQNQQEEIKKNICN